MRTFTNYSRYTFNGERRPMNPAPAERFEVSEPKLPGWVRVLMLVACSGIGWGVLAGAVVMAVELAR